jgi:hypothetical protein
MSAFLGVASASQFSILIEGKADITASENVVVVSVVLFRGLVHSVCSSSWGSILLEIKADNDSVCYRLGSRRDFLDLNNSWGLTFELASCCFNVFAKWALVLLIFLRYIRLAITFWTSTSCLTSFCLFECYKFSSMSFKLLALDPVSDWVFLDVP